jgi:hypothetical protein
MKAFITIHFRSGRTIELPAPTEFVDEPEKIAERMCDLPKDALFLQLGPHLLFTRQIERIEIADRSMTAPVDKHTPLFREPEA